MAHIIEDVDYYEYTHPQIDLPQELTLQDAASLYPAELCVEIVCICGILTRVFSVLSGGVGRGSHERSQCQP